MSTGAGGTGGIAVPAENPFGAEDWTAFVAAFTGGKAAFLHSHLYAAATAADAPTRDYWFRLAPGVVCVVLHVTFAGTWLERDETCITRVVARYGTRQAAEMYAEHGGHGPVLAGLPVDAQGFCVTATPDDATGWMDGRTNAPSPWRFLDDPDRTSPTHSGGVVALGPAAAATVPLTQLYAETGLTARFRDAHLVLMATHELLAQSFVHLYRFAGVPVQAVGEWDADSPQPDPDFRPFDSPKYWAGVAIAGDGLYLEA
jgi:hypothetical protein